MPSDSNGISCLWLEISPVRGKSFLVGNMYRPPDSKIEYNDRFEDFIDIVLNEEKEFILLGDFNKICLITILTGSGAISLRL